MAINVKKPPEPEKSKLNIWLIIVLALLVSITIIVRIHGLAIPLERDEGEYAYAGQLMLEGVPPYSLAYNMKMPGIYAAYAIILACFGQTQTGIHTAILIINTATIILLFVLTKKLLGPIAATAAAVFFAMTSVMDAIGVAGNAENFVLLFAIAGIILLMKFADSKKYTTLAAGGTLLGIAFITKQHGAAFIIFGGIFLIWQYIRQKPIDRPKIIPVMSVYCSTVLLPFAATCLILWYFGVFKKFWFWAFEYAYYYVTYVPAEVGIDMLKIRLTELIPAAPVIWLTALLGLLSVIWNKEIRKHSMFLFGLLVCSCLAVSIGLFFRSHYFFLFLPVLCIAAAAGVIAMRDLLGIFIKSKTKTGKISMLIILTVWLHSFYCNRDYFLETDINKLSKGDTNLNPFLEAVQIADYIKKHSNEDDKIAVMGSEPEIFFYSHRRSASSYIYIYPLMEPQPYAVAMQREMISQIEADKPKFFIYFKIGVSWLKQTHSNSLIIDWSQQYASTHYRQIGLIEKHYQNETIYRWGSSSPSLQPEGWIYVGERID